MRRRLPLLLFTLLCGATPLPAEVRVEMTRVGHLAPGQADTITWTVIGTKEPVRLLLRNRNPAFGTLEGGNVQFATTSGGSPNSVTRAVSGRMTGEFTVDAEIDPGRGASDEEVVAAFRRETARIAHEIENVSHDLPVAQTGVTRRRTVPLGAVLHVLDVAQADVRTSLPYPQLAPFQDLVTRFLREMRDQAINITLADAGTIVLVDDRPRPQAMPEEDARRVLGRVVEWFRRLSDTSPIGRICVQTTPLSGADVVLFPVSVPHDRHTTRSTAPLTLYLGHYAYQIQRDGFLESRGSVDLLLNPERVLDCPLRRNASDSQVCRLVAGDVENCR